MSSLTFVGRLLHDSSGLSTHAAHLCKRLCAVPAMIRLPGTLRLVILADLVNGDAAGVQAFRRSFAGTLQDSPSLG
jgi:hypothetical protein